MANFSLFDDDYGDLFITQRSREERVVSLEDNCEFRAVKDDKYSDISDVEMDVDDKKMSDVQEGLKDMSVSGSMQKKVGGSGISRVMGLNPTVKRLTKKARVVSAKAEGRVRNYNSVSESKIAKMMEINFKKRTEAKMKWAINCYNDWHEMRLDKVDYDDEIFEADLNNVGNLTRHNFEFALCRFICEVKKSKSDEDYPGRTLYQMVCALKNFLRKNEINWKIVHSDTEFQKFNRVLDGVMQVHASMSLGTVKHQAEVISMEFENKLWERGVLGEANPDQLQNTILYLVGINCALSAGDEHYALRRPGGCVGSQFSIERNSIGVRCIVYREDTVTKTNRGGLRDMKKERKVVWIKPNNDVNRCPVRLIEKYISLLPREGVKPNFYLHSLKKPRPYCWYGTTSLGINKVHSCVSEMLKDAGLNGYFTNHSLRRTCATRLFQSSANVKLIKEITGHVSNAVEKYKTTSDEQRMNLSKIIQGDVPVVKLSKAPEMEVVEEAPHVSDEQKFQLPKLKLPIASGSVKEVEEVEGKCPKSDVRDLIKSAIGVVGDRKAKVTVSIELID